MRFLYLALLYASRPFDPYFARDRQMKVALSAVPAGSLRASTAGAQPSIREFPLLGEVRGWAHV